ncbi:hypothetical protein [Streptomyces alfalfae]
MPIWNRVMAPARSHWRKVFLPVGFALNPWGNELYKTGHHRTASLILFFSGLLLAFYGVRFWRGFTDSWRTPKRIRRWVTARQNTPEWIARWDRLKTATWGAVVFAVGLYAWKLLGRIATEPDRVNAHFGSAMPLMMIWVLFPLYGQGAEPKNSPMERLSGRIWRAVVSRMVANVAGVYFVGVTLYAMVFPKRASLLVTVTVTLAIAVVVAVHKTWRRLRRLTTQMYKNVQTLKRDLDLIHGSETEKTGEKRDAARRSWDVVRLDLRTSVDTGYGFGTPVLPIETIDELNEKLEKAITAFEGDKDAAVEVLADLDKIQDACTSWIDSVA